MGIGGKGSKKLEIDQSGAENLSYPEDQTVTYFTPSELEEQLMYIDLF